MKNMLNLIQMDLFTTKVIKQTSNTKEN